MPRIATPVSKEVEAAQVSIRKYLQVTGTTQSELAQRAGVRQYTVSRLLNGRTKYMTPDVQKLLNHAVVGINEGIAELMADARLRRALDAAWDGTEAGAALLCRMIEALGPVVREATSAWPRAASHATGAGSRRARRSE